MRKNCLLSTLVLILTLLSEVTNAQDFSNKGKNFWISYPEHINGTGSIMGLYITSDVNTTGVISINGVNTPFTVTANTITPRFITNTGVGANVIGVNNYIHLGNLQDGIKTNAAVHVTSVLPVVVYAHIINSARSGATLVLPTNVWGKEYYVPSFTNSGGTGTGQGYGEINVMAALANTIVEITPSIVTRNGTRAAGVPYQITLDNPGDVYQVQFPQNTDLSGTKIRSIASGSSGCQPIAVISATTWSAINCNSGNGGDNFYQQLFPTGTWGKEFITTPLKKVATNPADNNVDIIRVYVKDPTTVVNKMDNGVSTTLSGLVTPGNYYQYTAFRPTSISADQPVQVMQFVTTQNCGSPATQSDPEMIALSAVEQTINDITVYSAISSAVPGGNSAVSTHYINVTMKTANTGSFRINGTVPTATFNTIPGTNYSYLKQPIVVSEPVSRLTADSGFNAIAYGFGNVESYGYNAGTNVKDQYQEIGVSTQYGIEPTPSVCKGSPFKFKVKLPYCIDSIRWDLSQLPGPPAAPPTQIYSTCTPGPGGPDSITVVNGKTLYWYSLPNFYTFNVSGAFPVTMFTYSPNSEGCGNEQEIPFTLNVYDPPVADFTWTGSGCVAEPVSFADNTTTPRPSYIWNWDFGDPGSGANNISGLQNPTHLFSAPGPYNVTFSTITTPGCVSSPITKQIIVAPVPTATIDGATTVCINTNPEPQVTFTAAGGTAPYTFSYHINAGPAIHVNSPTATLTVNVPTGVAGTFTYYLDSVKNTGSNACVTTYSNTSVAVTVNANTGLALSAGSDNQAVCQNTGISNIQYTISGGGNDATASGLPAGVTGVYNAGTFTISGTPTTPGTYNYTVTATGLCQPNSLTGTITVNPDAAIALNTANNTQTLCINNPVGVILYSISGGGTGATVSGLPAGVTGSYSGGVFTISGSPTVAGTFNYTVNTTGTCVQTSATGTLTITPDATLTLTSAAPTTNQTVCVNHPITNITYQWGGSATDFTMTGLPAGVTATHIGGGVVQITGTPTAFGTFPYSIQSQGPCVNPIRNGTITVTAESTIDLTSAGPTTNQELCVNNTITDITYQVSGSATGANVTGLPAGVTSSFAGGVLTISGAPTASGTFNFTVVPTGPCVETDQETGTITVNARPTPNFNITTPSCATRVITFTDNSVPNSGVMATWSWDFGDPASGPLNTSTDQNPTHVYANPGPYVITLNVTNDKGCGNSIPLIRNITINARPKAGFIVPEVCINDLATVFTDTSRVTGDTFDPTGYHWNFGDPPSGPLNTSTAMNGSHLYTAIGPYNVTHVATTMSGCKDTVTNVIFINAADPTADFVINNNAALCSNDSVSLVNRSTISQGSVTKLEIYWDVTGSPGTFETIDVPVFNGVYKHKYPTLQTTQTYNIRLVAYSGAICFANKPMTITVNAAPRAQFNAVPAVCYDAAPFSLVPYVSDGGVPGTRTFSGPGVSPAGIFNPASVAPGGTYTIKYLHTATVAGCVDSATQDITVYDTASARITYDPVRCEQQAVTFNSNTSTIPASAGTITGWNWNFGDPGSGANNTSTAASPAHTFNAWGTYNVTLTVVSSNGCRSTARVEPVRISPQPLPAFGIPPSLCLPSATAAFNNGSTLPDDGSGATLTYVWDFGDPGSGPLNTSTGTSPSHIYNGVGPYTVTLQATSTAGCTATTTRTLNTIHPQPEADFTVSPGEVCIGDEFTFTDNTDYKDGTRTSINWDLKDGNTRTVPTFQYTYTTAGTYNVELYAINSHGCRSTLHTEPVTVHPYPVVDAGPDRLVLEGGQITLDPIVTGNDLSYVWTPNNSYIIGSNTVKNLVVKGVDDIRYLLTVTSRGGCSDTSSVFIKVLKFPSIPNIFSPNGDGVHDKWVIDYLNTYPGSIVEIYNRYGQMIFRSEGYNTPWDGTVNGKPVPVGTYYYIVNPKNGRPVMTGYVDVIR